MTNKYRFWEFVSENEHLAQKHTIKDLGGALKGDGHVVLVGRALY